MRRSRIPILLLLLLSAPAWAQQVELVTFGSGLGRIDVQARQLTFSMGAPLLGQTHDTPAGVHGYFGFWEMLLQTQVEVGVEDGTPVLRNELFRNYPNPFNPSTRISFTVAAEGLVRVELYDLKGRKVDTLLDEVLPTGAHTITYQPRGLASGAYVILMRAGTFRASQRVMLVK